MNDSKTRLSRATVVLHWIVAVAVIALLASGIIMEEFGIMQMVDIHKSIGVIAFAIILARVVWRARQGWPPPVREYERWEQRLSKVVHYALIIGTVIMPASGIGMSIAGGTGVDIFGLELVARNIDPANPGGRPLPINETAAEVNHEIHATVGYIMLAALVLHIAGALKHHIKDGDNTLRRMLGAKGD